MKKLALHFGFPQSIVGITDTGNKLHRILKIDSIILFEEKNKFPKRLESIVNSNLKEIKTKFDQIIFSIPGTVRSDKGKIYSSSKLNRLAFRDPYDHFSFKDNFRHLCDPRDILLQSPIVTFSRSLLGNRKVKFPVLFIFDEEETGSKVFTSAKDLENFKFQSLPLRIAYDEPEKKSIDLLDVVEERHIDITKIYSKNLNSEILRNIKLAKKNSVEFKTVYIISKNSDLISPEYITSQSENNYKLIVEPIISKECNSPMLGCEIYPINDKRNKLPNRRKRERKRVIVRVEYFSENNRLLNSTTKYLQFKKHIEKELRTSSPKNYYNFILENGKFIKMVVADAYFHMSTKEVLDEFEEL